LVLIRSVSVNTPPTIVTKTLDFAVSSVLAFSEVGCE